MIWNPGVEERPTPSCFSQSRVDFSEHVRLIMYSRMEKNRETKESRCASVRSTFSSSLTILSLVSSHHHHHHPHAHRAYNPSHTTHYNDGVTSAPGTMNHPCGGRQRSAGYEDMHQCSLPKPVSATRKFEGYEKPHIFSRTSRGIECVSDRIHWRWMEFHMALTALRDDFKNSTAMSFQQYTIDSAVDELFLIRTVCSAESSSSKNSSQRCLWREQNRTGVHSIW